MLYQYSGFTFPFLILLGIVLGVLLIIKKIKKLSLDKKSFERLLCIMAISGALFYIGSRLFDDLFHYLNGEVNHKGGITFMGGMVSAVTTFIVMFVVFLKPIRKNFFKILNIVVLGIILGHAIGRIGCFLSGCCFGKPTNSIIGVNFPGTAEVEQFKDFDLYRINLYGSDAYEAMFKNKVEEILKRGEVVSYKNYSFYFSTEEDAYKVFNEAKEYAENVKLIPTQLLESLFLFILFGALMFINKYNLGLYMISYGIFRFFIEYLRVDNRGSVLLGISPSQLISIIIVILGIVCLVLNILQVKKEKHKEKTITN